MTLQDVTQYTSLTPVEHVKARMSMYVGDCTYREEEQWIWKDSKMSREAVGVCPGLEKLMLEAIDNAIDNMQRIPPTTEIRVTMDQSLFSCSNNGAHIPIQQKDGKWIPSTIFSEMHSGSNFGDHRTATGMNGLGIKLAAILSDNFQVECVDPIASLYFKQCATNGDTWSEPTIRPPTKKQLKGMTTTVRFQPHLPYFNIDRLDVLLPRIQTRLAQLSSTGVKVYFNNMRINVSGFQRYIQSFPFSSVVYASLKDLEFGLAVSPTDDFVHHSFVNHIPTEEGGTHVRSLEYQITSALFAHFDGKSKKRKQDVRLSRANIRNRMVLFCSFQVQNPEFTSQSKRQLSSPCVFSIDTTLIMRLARKCGLLDQLSQLLEGKETIALGNALNSRKRKAIHIENLTDAVYAGTARSNQCSLLVVEGLSAKTFAVSGLAEVGHQHYGIYPIRGKPINTFHASHTTIGKNKEIGELCKILGLVIGRDYGTEDALRTLRYRHMIILTDADVDGYHICGLLLAFLERLFPSLLRMGFVKRFVTPLLIASHRDRKREFFTMHDYHQWSQNHPKWTVKYFKGLGSSTKDQARGYFRHLKRYVKPMTIDETTPERLALLFDSKQSDARKRWMQETIPTTLDYTAPTMAVTRFVDTELHEFSLETLNRAIPALMDGLKESQRKVLFAAIRKCTQSNQEIKIAQLGAFAAEITAYAHGEKSIQDTCNKMTHSFVGSNNLPLLEACGNTGSRLQMGGDAASTRYTFTRLMPYTRQIFDSRDDPLLTPRHEEGMTIEYEEYTPILPMIIINGCSGIATGYRTLIPCHQVQDVVEQLVRRLTTGESFTPISPYYNGWTGTISETETEWRFTGCYTLHATKCVVTELPITCATERYKTNVLHRLIEKRHIVNVIEAHPDENQVRFEFEIYPSFDPSMLELTTSLSKRCMNLLVDGRIRGFQSITELLDVYYQRRLQRYRERREHLLTTWRAESEQLSHRRRFIQYIVEGKLPIHRVSKSELVSRAVALGLPDSLVESFVQMPVLSLTTDRLAELDQKIKKISMSMQELETSTPEQLWLADLETFRQTRKRKFEYF